MSCNLETAILQILNLCASWVWVGCLLSVFTLHSLSWPSPTLSPFLFWCEITVRVDEGSLLTEKANGPSQTPRDVLESSGSIVWDCEPACHSLTRPWPSASNRNPFLPLLFVKPDGLMKAILMCHFLTCSRAKAFFPFLLTECSGLVFKGKKLFSSSCSFSFFTSYSETRLGKKSNFTLSVPERINTVKLHWISTATFFLGSISDP